MKSIIEDIIEIDSVAQKRIDEAKKIKEDVSKQIELEKEQMNAELNSKAENRVLKIEEAEKRLADEETAAIQKETDEKLSALRENFEKIKDKLENEIYQNVIK